MKLTESAFNLFENDFKILKCGTCGYMSEIFMHFISFIHLLDKITVEMGNTTNECFSSFQNAFEFRMTQI